MSRKTTLRQMPTVTRSYEKLVNELELAVIRVKELVAKVHYLEKSDHLLLEMFKQGGGSLFTSLALALKALMSPCNADETL